MTPLAWNAGRCTAPASRMPWGATRCLNEAAAGWTTCPQHSGSAGAPSPAEPRPTETR